MIRNLLGIRNHSFHKLIKSNYSTTDNSSLKPFGGKIQYMSDLHIDHKQWNSNGRPPNLRAIAPYLVIAGDLGNIGSRIFNEFLRNVNSDFDQVIFVPGNHEFYGYEYHRAIDKMKSMEAQYPHLHVLVGPNGNKKPLCGTKNPANNGGSTIILPLNNDEYVRIIGCTLWSEIPDKNGILSMIQNSFGDYRKIFYHNPLDPTDPTHTRLFTPIDSNLVHQREINWLQEVFWENLVDEFDSKDGSKYNKIKNLIVTHHTPLVEECCHPKYLHNSEGDFDRSEWSNWAFSTRLNWLIHELQPTAWVFGHTHYSTIFRYKWTCQISQSEHSTILASNPTCNKSFPEVYNDIDQKYLKTL